jgi:hypothetical protein
MYPALDAVRAGYSHSHLRCWHLTLREQDGEFMRCFSSKREKHRFIRKHCRNRRDPSLLLGIKKARDKELMG